MTCLKSLFVQFTVFPYEPVEAEVEIVEASDDNQERALLSTFEKTV